MAHNHDPTNDGRDFDKNSVLLLGFFLSAIFGTCYLVAPDAGIPKEERAQICTPIQTEVLADFAQHPFQTKQNLEAEGHSVTQSIRANYWLSANGKFGLHSLGVPNTQHHIDTISLDEFNTLLSDSNRGLSITTSFEINTTNNDLENPQEIICYFSDRKQLTITPEPA